MSCEVWKAPWRAQHQLNMRALRWRPRNHPPCEQTGDDTWQVDDIALVDNSTKAQGQHAGAADGLIQRDAGNGRQGCEFASYGAVQLVALACSLLGVVQQSGCSGRQRNASYRRVGIILYEPLRMFEPGALADSNHPVGSALQDVKDDFGMGDSGFDHQQQGAVQPRGGLCRRQASANKALNSIVCRSEQLRRARRQRIEDGNDRFLGMLMLQ